MSEPCAVTIRNGQSWSSGLSTPQIFRVVARMEDIGFRSIEAGAIERLGLKPRDDVPDRDADEQQADDEGEDTKKKAGISDQRKATKALAMEVAVAEALTRLDHPEKVQSFWGIAEPGNEPTHFAPARTPDLLVPATPSAPTFQIVCEVSSGRTMTRDYLRTQLDGALRHCRTEHKKRKTVEVTYGLLVNSGNIATDLKLQRAYRRFIKDNEDVLSDPMGEIRIVSLRTADFSLILQRLYNQRRLEFPKARMVRALDQIHVELRQTTVRNDKEWMLKLFIDTVTAEPDLLDQEAASN